MIYLSRSLKYWGCANEVVKQGSAFQEVGAAGEQ
jgi:hypothetical protein